MTSEQPISTFSDKAYKQCRFGNFIGEAEESEDESQKSLNGYDAYVDDDNADEDGAPNDQQLMEIDGWDNVHRSSSQANLNVQKMGHPMQSYSMKISSIILRRNRYTVPMWRLWFKRKMRSLSHNRSLRPYSRRNSLSKKPTSLLFTSLETL